MVKSSYLIPYLRIQICHCSGWTRRRRHWWNQYKEFESLHLKKEMAGESHTEKLLGVDHSRLSVKDNTSSSYLSSRFSAFPDLYWLSSHTEAHPWAAGCAAQRHCCDSPPRAPGTQQHLPEQRLLIWVRWSWLLGLFPALQPDWGGRRNRGGLWSLNGKIADPRAFFQTLLKHRRGGRGEHDIRGGRGWAVGRKEECSGAEYEQAVHCIIRRFMPGHTSGGASVQQGQQSLSLPLWWWWGIRERRRSYPSRKCHPKHFLQHLPSAFPHVCKTHDFTGQIPGQKAGEGSQTTTEKLFRTPQWASYWICGGRDRDQPWPETCIPPAYNAEVLLVWQWCWSCSHQRSPSQEEQVSGCILPAFTQIHKVRWRRGLSKSQGRFHRWWSGREELVGHSKPSEAPEKKRICGSSTREVHTHWVICSLKLLCWTQGGPQTGSGADGGWYLCRLPVISGWVIYLGSWRLWVFKQARLLWGAESWSSQRKVQITRKWWVWWSGGAADFAIPTLIPRSETKKLISPGAATEPHPIQPQLVCSQQRSVGDSTNGQPQS